MGNKGTLNIVGIDDVKIMTNLGYKFVLKDIRHVANLMLNLISVRRLDDEGFESRFGTRLQKMMKISLFVASAKKSNTLYKLAAQDCGGQLNTVEKDSNIELWHWRLEHMSKKGLHPLLRRSALLDFKVIHLNPCVDCLASK